MTQKEATEVRDLAKPVYDAIPIIAEKAGTEWQWEPEAGNEFMDNFNEYFWGHRCVILSVNPVSFLCWDYDEGCQRYISKDAMPGMIPLFPMEKLEGILEGIGYLFSIDEAPHGETPDYRLAEHFVWIFGKSGKVIARGKGKTRQQALRLAVIGLGKM